MNVHSILVPFDFSTPSGVALGEALELALAFEARVTMLHVYQQPPPDEPYATDGEVIEIRDRSARDRLLDEVRHARKRAPDVVIEHQLLIGTPAVVVAEAAASHDLVVMGTHGRSGASHLLLGSVTESVIRRAPCPVWVVPNRLHPTSLFDHERDALAAT